MQEGFKNSPVKTKSHREGVLMYVGNLRCYSFWYCFVLLEQSKESRKRKIIE